MHVWTPRILHTRWEPNATDLLFVVPKGKSVELRNKQAINLMTVKLIRKLSLTAINFFFFFFKIHVLFENVLTSSPHLLPVIIFYDILIYTVMQRRGRA